MLCFAYEGLAINGAQHCTSGGGAKSGWWVLLWSAYAAVLGVMVTATGLIIRKSWMEWRRLVRRERKGKWRADDVDRSERGESIPAPSCNCETIELEEIRPNHLIRLDERRWAENAGESSSRMGSSRGASMARSWATSTAEKASSVEERQTAGSLGRQRDRSPASRPAAPTYGRMVRPRLQIRRGGKWEDADAIELDDLRKSRTDLDVA